MTPDSLWGIRLYEAALPLLGACVLVSWGVLMSSRARRNRAKLRRQRQAERGLVRRLRAW